jgi:spermidine/putrescine transport system permease protein
MRSEWAFFVGVPGFVWQVLFFYIPLMCILFMALCSWHNFTYFFTSTYFLIIARSLGLSLTTTVLCLLIGYPVAYFIAFSSKKIKNFLLFLIIVPFWTNFLLHVCAWFFVLERNGFLNTLLLRYGIIQEPLSLLNNMFATILMMVYYYLPFMILPLYSILEKFDYRFIEASLDLGATMRQTMMHIIFPLTVPAMQAGVFLVFVPAFGEFVIPELMGGDRHMFVGTVISYYILGAKTIAQGAAFTMLSISILLMVMGILYVTTQKLRDGNG